MANELKELIIGEIVAKYQNTNNCLVAGYQGIKATEFDQLRKDMQRKKIGLQIVKNSLAVIAFKKIGMTGVVDMLKGPSLIVASESDPVLMAKEAIEWSKKIPSFSLRGGLVDRSLVSVGEIKELAKLPSLPVLHTQIAVGIGAPIVGVVNAFGAVMRSLATVMNAVKEQKEKSGG